MMSNSDNKKVKDNKSNRNNTLNYSYFFDKNIIKIIKGRISVNYIFGLIVFIIYFVYFCYLFNKIQLLRFSYLFIGGISIILHFLIYKNISRSSLFVFLLMSSLIILFGFFSPQYDLIIDIYTYGFGLVSFFCAYKIYFFKSQNLNKVVLLFFWFLTFIIFSLFAIHGIDDPDVYNLIFDGSSRNYVSLVYILILMMLHLSYDKDGKVLPFVYSLIVFLGCIILFGRTGIILSALILIYALWKTSIRKKIKVLLLCVVCIFAIYNSTFLVEFFNEKTSFRQGLDSPRADMLDEYISYMGKNLYVIIFGGSLERCCQTIALHDFNTHNSFIDGHVRYGIFHTVISILIYLYVLSSKKFLLVFFISLLYLRYWFDQVGLFSENDIVLFYIFLYAYFLKNQKINKK